MGPDFERRLAALSPAQRDALRRRLEARPTPQPLLHQLVERQARLTPDRVAVIAGERSLTFGKLEAQANRLARHLAGHGAGRGRIVAICMERSPELVIAQLAVLKAGAAYLPMDPGYPSGRLAFMREDAAAPLLLTDLAGESRLPATTAAQVLLSADCAVLENGDNAPFSAAVGEEDPAYVIYTSGSTGQPKGALIPHRAIVNHMLWMAGRFPVGDADAVLQKTPASADASVWEFYLPLMGGARLVLAEPGSHADPGAIARQIAAFGITVAQFVPSMLDLFIEHPRSADCRSLKRVFAGGEALAPALVARVRRRLDVELVNLYGPTETAVDATCFVCDRGDHAPRVPIGAPIAHTRVHVLDEHLQPVPPGEPGELYIGGRGVGLGYLNRPELTAARFIPDPFDPSRPGLLYRTGDRCRLLPDGNLDFLGRVDDQIKIRGYRIEPGEVEAALTTIEGVQAALAVAREDRPGDVRLVAYITAHPGASPPDPRAIRARLSGCLPAHLVPDAVVRLDHWPLTPNGKVDRKALPAPDARIPEAAPPAKAPQSLEERLCALWAEVLGLATVRPDDDFFELSGHSLLAARLFARMAREFHVDIPLKVLFEAPTVAALAQRVAESTDRDVDLQALPLSFSQQRLWFIERLEPGSGQFNMAEGFIFDGPFDLDAFERALRALVVRHECLRSRFVEKDGIPMRVLLPAFEIPMTIEDCGNPDRDAFIELMRSRLESEARTPFRLSDGPPVRARIVRLDARTHGFVFNCHHIISDGISRLVFHRDLEVLYADCAAGRSESLPPLELTYSEHVRRERERFDGGHSGEAIAYWKGKLEGAPSFLQLPYDRPPDPRGSVRAGSVVRDLTPELAADIESFCRTRSITLFMGLLAVFKILLGRLSGQDDVVVGTAIAARDDPGAERVFGLFLGTLALRTSLADNPTLEGFLQRVRTTVLEAFDHKELPFEQVIEIARPSRDVHATPLFQVLFNMTPGEADDKLDLNGLEVEKLQAVASDAKYALTLYVGHKAGNLRLTAVYRAERFESRTIEVMLDQYIRLIEQFVANPDLHIYSASLLTSRSRGLLPDPTKPLRKPPQRPVTERIEAIARMHAGAPAVRMGEREWSYGQLLEAAGALVRGLRDAGASAGSVVIVTGPRSFGLIAAMIAVMRCRAVLLLVDPDLPVGRRETLLQESGARHLLAVDERVTGSPRWSEAFHGLRVLEVQSDTPPGGIMHDRAAIGDFPNPGQDDPAYIFFTSGTTGKPKAILGSHGSLSHFIEWESALLEVAPGDRVAQLTGHSFDVILRDVFLPLCNGATLCLPESSGGVHRLTTLQWLKRERVSIAHCVPSLAASWIGEADGRDLPLPLRAVLFAGEPLTAGFVRRWREVTGDKARVYNLYGTTETTLAKAFYAVPVEPLPGIQPVGRPLPSAQVLVLNAAGMPCGLREPGEIVIRTPFATFGYLNAEEADAARFAVNPFRDDPHDVVYHTGDRGAFAADGNLLIFGRFDDQVKIRGIRIEPAEVAAHIARHPGVRQCVVMARVDQCGETYLAAYCVPEPDGASVDEGSMRSFLRQGLPEYLIPATFAFMDHMPLNSNGKIDRNALPDPVAVAAQRGPASRPPTAQLEREIAAIWSEVLNLDCVGIDQNFFDIGGHSLSATRVLALVSRRLGLDLPLRSLFEHPTIEEWIAHLDSASSGANTLQFKADQEARTPLALSQERLWFLDRMGGGSPEYNMAGAFELEGDLKADLLEDALNAVVRRHESLRTLFGDDGGLPFQLILPQLRIPLEREDLRSREDPEASLDAAMRRFGEHVFDLSTGPLLRARLFRTGDQRHVLSWLCHHIISDGWSVGVLNRELGAAYAAACDGRDFDGPELTARYADYARWQRVHLSGDRLLRQTRYWAERLRGTQPLELPVDRPRPARADHAGGRHGFELTPSLARRLERFSREAGATAYMTFMAAFQVLLYRYTGQEDIVVGTPIANRQRVEFEPLIGFFVNMLAQRTDLSGSPTFRELVGRVREGALEAYEHQDLPFNKVIEAVNPPRDLSRHPLFQVSMALQSAPRAQPEFPGLAVRGVESPTRTTHFELGLFLWPTTDAWTCRFVYMTRLFEAGTIERMAGHFVRLLENLLENPDQPVGVAPMLSDAEREELPRVMDGGAPAIPAHRSVPDLFSEQAMLRPHAVAVELGDRQITYGELERRANGLCRRLREGGVAPGDRVGISLDRSVELVVAFLAVLKAGAAYVPLARDYPSSRIHYIVADAGLRHVIARSDDPPGLPENVRILDPSDIAEAAFGDRAPAAPDADAAAYVIYTSGSTGEPKGVEVPHRAIIRLVRGQEYADFSPGRRFLLLASPAFDASTFEIWAPLLNGGTLAVFPERYPDLDEIDNTLRAHAVDCVWLTAGLFNLIVDTRPELLRRVKHVLTGGETLSPAHVRRAFDTCPKLRVSNCYGPTECTTFACTHAIPRDQPADQAVPIGRPIAHTFACIVDRAGQLVPRGVIGELCLGGHGLATGYLNQPDLTREKFVGMQLSGDAPRRIYRTGDLCRLRADGLIDFTGRRDQQVKIRGFRLELGEVEAALRAHEAVRSAAVVARRDASGTLVLDACFTVREAAEPPDGAQLRAFLGRRLPEYALPRRCIAVAEIPLTPNGKVDYTALPEVGGETPDTAAPGDPPRTGMEKQLAQIWQGLFGQPEIQRRDHFFQLGGHSLLAARMLAEVRRKTGRQLPISAIFECPTLAELAARLAQPVAAPASRSLVTLQPDGDRPPLFCVHGWGGDVYGFLDLARVLAPEQPVYGLQAVGMDGSCPRHDSVDAMADHYACEIRAFRAAGPYNLLGYSAGGWIAYAVAQRLRRDGCGVRLFMLDTGASCRVPYLFHAINKSMRLAQRLPLHLRRLFQSPRGERMAYLRGRLGWLMVNIRRTGAPPARAAAHDGSNGPAPVDYFAQVASLYRPDRYSGDLVLFACRGSPDYTRWFWKYLVRGTVEVHFVDGGHHGLINRDNVGNFAERFRKVLAEDRLP
jgi:amino acid adenylation domain-containing protein